MSPPHCNSVSKINIVILKPSSLRWWVVPATATGTAYTPVTTISHSDSHCHIQGWHAKCRRWAQCTKPPDLRVKECHKTSRIQNCPGHTFLIPPVFELFGLQEAQSGSLPSCQLPLSLSISFAHTDCKVRTFPLWTNYFSQFVYSQESLTPELCFG